ncbi:MAG: DUF4957 domain-containing protein [Prevotella sp.]|nr:DUF4957 domain-containing protein [Prevotella sp.]
MRKKTFFLSSKLWCLGAFALSLLATSCAQDGFDNDEVFTPEVRNAQLESPAVEDIIVTSSPDGKSQTITWPVVSGAGGYLVSFYDEGNADQYIVNDSIVDGCSVTTKREEDANYVFTIKTLGNEKMNNKGAETATEKKISTFTPTYMTIPAGSDLNAWFAANPVPAAAVNEMHNYDLEADGEYTISDVLDFGAHRVTLRSNDKVNHAKITYLAGKAPKITTTAEMNIKYIDFDCSGQSASNGVFEYSKDNTVVPAANTIDPALYKWAGAYIADPITFVSCNFDNVMGYFFFDNSVNTFAENVLVENCVVHLTPATSNGGAVFYTNKGGHINNLKVTTSTFYESDDCTGDIKYFFQDSNKAPDLYVDGTGAAAAATNSVTYTNCTFYHVTWNDGQWGNYNGMQSKNYSYWIMYDCIFYDCSPSGVARRFLHGRTGQLHADLQRNTYMSADGTFQDPGSYDPSGTDIKDDPQFANPANADFTIGASTQQAILKTGDPRWLP